MNRRQRSRAVLYLAVQTLAAFGWWIGMLTRPDWRAWFFVDTKAEMYWMSFLIPDLAFFVGAGAMAAIGIRHEERWARSMLFVHLGGVGYAALFNLSSSLISGVAWPGTILMLGSFCVVAMITRSLRPS